MILSFPSKQPFRCSFEEHDRILFANHGTGSRPRNTFAQTSSVTVPIRLRFLESKNFRRSLVRSAETDAQPEPCLLHAHNRSARSRSHIFIDRDDRNPVLPRSEGKRLCQLVVPSLVL